MQLLAGSLFLDDLTLTLDLERRNWSGLRHSEPAEGWRLSLIGASG